MGQTFVERVESQHEFPITLSLHLLKADLVTAAGVSLAQRARPRELIRDAGDFLDDPHIPELRVRILLILVHQDVDTRPMLPGLQGHVVRRVDENRPFMFQIVAREFQAVALAVLVIRLGPALDVQIQQHLEVVVPHAPPITDGSHKTRKMFQQRVSPTILKLLREIVRPGQTTCGKNRRLVGEHTRDLLAELRCEPLTIRFERDVQKPLCDAGIQKIHITATGIPGSVRRAHDNGRQVIALGHTSRRTSNPQ